MASKGNIEMDVVVEDQTSVGLASAQKNIDNFTTKNAKSSKSLKKDWSGLGDLFSTLLPRGMQRTVRSFRSTSRSVGRLSKSFKVLKAAWASVGIGLAIIAVEQLIENWDKLSEAIGISSAADKRNAEITKRSNEQRQEITNSLIAQQEAYLSVLDDEYASEQQRAVAIEKLNENLNGLIDTEADLETQREQARVGVQATIRFQNAQIENAAALEKVEKARAAQQEGESLWFERKIDTVKRLAKDVADAEENAATWAETLTFQTVEYNKRVGEANQLITDRADAEKEAARLKAESLRQEEANAKYLADLEKKLNEEILLNSIESEQLREEKVLELRMQEQKKKAEDAGATAAQLQLIEQDYQNDLRKLRKRFTDEEEAEKLRNEAERIADNEALQEELFLNSLNEEEREKASAERIYNNRLEMAKGNVALLLQVQEEYLQELDIITDKYAQERLDKSQEETDEEIRIKQAGQKLLVSSTRQLFGAMEELAGENAEQAKAFAIADVLLAQAVSTANAIRAASQASGDPYTLVANIIVAVASIVSAFVGVRQLLEEAGASGGGFGGGGGVAPTAALVPEQVSRTESVGKSFVVQSDLEGANLQANQLYNQTALGGG